MPMENDIAKPGPSAPTPLVRGVDLTMSFGGVTVLKNANVSLFGGQVHGLVGENGAGKCTLAKLMGGVYLPKSGSIFVDGMPVTLPNPKAAIAHGIALIHQEPLTFPDLTVAENIFIGRQPRGIAGVNWSAMVRRGGEILSSLGVDIDPRAGVRGLSIADQQMVEMAGALSQNARVFLMDETTAALTPTEVESPVRHHAAAPRRRGRRWRSSGTGWKRSSRSATGSRSSATARWSPSGGRRRRPSRRCCGSWSAGRWTRCSPRK